MQQVEDMGQSVEKMNFKEPEGQLARWLERLQEYDFKEQRPFQTYTPEDIKKLQEDGPAIAIGPVLRAVGSGNYPPEDSVKSWSLEGRSLLQQSKMLQVLDGVLWRRFLNGGAPPKEGFRADNASRVSHADRSS
ncbi:hypothetical protein EMCRGX_G012750 [Ephydatia muelleri]